ncbi:MAG: glutathione peroxidase [Bdellovibrionales bacterium]|nr:glutathione peroxidase [Bdellovibrionales bacterium]
MLRSLKVSDLFTIPVKTVDGTTETLEKYKGKTLLIVNVASKCGFTPQYEGLEQIYREYKDRGLEVLAFPCNQFGAQEPGDEAEIKNFCSLKYDVSFPLFAKIDVNGDGAHPLYKYLKSELAGIFGTEAVKWNFTKFVIDKNGKPYKRFAPKDTPKDIIKELEPIL